MKYNTGVVFDARYKRHRPFYSHPECPERLDAVERGLMNDVLMDRCMLIDPIVATEERILTNHSEEYFNRLRATVAAGDQMIDSSDCFICKHSWSTALLAVGGVIAAIDCVMAGGVRNAFCAVRPPGHHAERDFSMGFCLFNNVAIGVRHLLSKYGLERVLILDWDVHHGNGTQHSFYSDPRVFYCSFHGHPETLFPGTGYECETGRGDAEGTTLNIMMKPGSGDSEYRKVYEDLFLPQAEKFNPDVIMISSGFDAHKDDMLGTTILETSSFEWLTRKTVDLAEQCCSGKIISVLEGGYNMMALEECVTTHCKALST